MRRACFAFDASSGQDRPTSRLPSPLSTTYQHTTMDRQSVYTLSLFGEDKAVEESNKRVQKELVDFVLEFHLDNVFIYR